jgi:signal transduction histidine kinase
LHPKKSLKAHGMSQSPTILDENQRPGITELARLWAGDAALAAAVGTIYLAVAQVTALGMAFQPDKSALFWPPAGISSGVLIVLGPRRRWAAVAGIAAAEAVAAQLSWHNPWLTAALAVCNPAEALTVAGLITRFFGGTHFALDRARNVFGLLGAAIVAAIAPSLGAAVAKRLLLGPSIMTLSTWQHWFAGDVIGIVIVAPLVIGLSDALRHPPSRSEYIEGFLALLSLAIVTSIIVSLPRKAWEVLLPVAWPFPILLWLAGRSQPAFAAAGAFLVSNIMVWTTTFEIGRFGDTSLALGDRVLEAQTAILFLSVSAYILAALFAERRSSAEHLVQVNAALRQERDNKLMTLEATTAAIAHEINQPLTAMVLNAEASLHFLEQAPPHIAQVTEALTDIVADGHRTSDALNGIGALFRKVDEGRQSLDLNEIILGVLHALRGELDDHRINIQTELISQIPLIDGNKAQLHQVVYNLVRNAIEAMQDTRDSDRVLRLTTQRQDGDRIAITVQDTGPGIVREHLGRIFDAFVTTKLQGTGLGLAICQAIAQRHGGELTAFSDGKSGALFRLSLPIENRSSVAPKVSA